MNTKARNPIIDFEEIMNGLLDHHQETTGEIVPAEIKSLMLNYGERTALMSLVVSWDFWPLTKILKMANLHRS